jgi:hypothetical protein
MIRRLFHRSSAIISKLHQVLNSGKIKSVNGFYDWESIQMEHFPEVDALQLAYIHEYHIKNDINDQYSPTKRAISIKPRFSKIADQRVLECMDRGDWSPGRKMAYIDGGRFPFPVYQQRLKFLRQANTSRSKRLRIEELHHKGLSAEQISIKLKLSPAEVYAILKNIQGQAQNESHSLSILVRRQYNVIGPDWEGLASLVRKDVPVVRRLVTTASPIWDMFMTSFSDPQPAGSAWRHRMKYTSAETAKLVSLVQKYRSSSGSTEQIDWLIIAQHMNRSPESIKQQYENYLQGLRSGFYSLEEDRQLLRVYIDNGCNLDAAMHFSIQRKPGSIKERLKRLIEHARQGKGPGHQLAVEMGIRDELCK